MNRTWTIVELLPRAAQYLSGKGVTDARLNAELLLAGILGLKRLDLYLQFDRPLESGEVAEFRERLQRRARREPLQYIEGTASFRDLQLRVDGRVLIPRPETEVLVEEVLHWAESRSAGHALDVGTGSGAIALSLAVEGRFERIVAVDVSGEALEVAADNHRRIAAGARVEFRQGSGYAPVAGERFDVVVSNPPYIADSEREGLEPEVREWEPRQALFAGASGLELIETLVAGAPRHLREGGLLALEVGSGQADRTCELIERTRVFHEPRVRRDLAGRDRIVLAELRQGAPPAAQA